MNQNPNLNSVIPESSLPQGQINEQQKILQIAKTQQSLPDASFQGLSQDAYQVTPIIQKAQNRSPISEPIFNQSFLSNESRTPIKTENNNPHSLQALRSLKVQDINFSSLKKADQCHNQLRNLKDFIFNPNTGLYSIVHISGQANYIPFIGDAYVKRLKSANLYLMNQLKIGSHVRHEKIKQLLGVRFESLEIFQLHRIWKQSMIEHSFDFFENNQNSKILKHLILRGDYFSPKFLDKESVFNFEQLEILELDFQTQMSDSDLYYLIDKIAEFQDTFTVILWTDKLKTEFNGEIKSYIQAKRIILKRKAENNPKKQKASTNLQRSIKDGHTNVINNGTIYENMKDILTNSHVGPVNFGPQYNINNNNTTNINQNASEMIQDLDEQQEEHESDSGIEEESSSQMVDESQMKDHRNNVDRPEKSYQQQSNDNHDGDFDNDSGDNYDEYDQDNDGL